ncbi:SusC/RagA family TonB-linked outer membrane protein [Myroides sp. LJL115]
MKSNFTPIYGYGVAMALLSLCFSPSLLHANSIPTRIEQEQQKVTITGTIKDFNGALPGVVVQVKNKNTATITDVDGKYSIQASPSETLVFSYIGYSGQEITINQKRIIDLELQQNSQELEEVIVNAGYYSVKDKERTGSIARVTAKDIELQPVINPLQALQGRMAGVDITQATGTPGGGMRVEIRGRNFLGDTTTKNAPLYIINGVPISSENLGSNSINQNTKLFPLNISPLNSIPPSDIESIEVLKDADATAIYGSRGANGVILITTKKGKQGNVKFTVSSSLGFSKVNEFMDMMNTEDYIKMRKEAFANSGVPYGPTDYDVNGTWDQTRYTNWQKELIGDTAVDKTVSLGVSGGSELANFNINLSHNETTTVYPTDKGYKRNSALLNFSQRSRNNKLNIGATVNYSNQTNHLPNVDFIQQTIQLPPNAPSLYLPDGSLNWENGTFSNPLAQLEFSYLNEINTFLLNTTLSYTFLPSTTLNINSGISKTYFEDTQLRPHTGFNPAFGYTSEVSSSSINQNNNLSYLIEPQINFNRKWNKNAFNFIVGTTLSINTSNFLSLEGNNFSSNTFITNISAAKNKNINQNTNTQYKYTSAFLRANYIYDEKYILNLTARRDGSSRFASNNKFGNFGALGTAWIISKENFSKNWKWLSFAKLRGSYGITGSDNIGDYAYLDTYDLNYSFYGNELNLRPTALYNPNYRWEKTTKIEGALELSFLKDRINTSVAYYNNRSGNQLVGSTLPSTTGFDQITMNFPALVENQGWEFTLNTTNIRSKNFYWTTGFNISWNKNKLISYPGLETGTQSSTYIIGKPLNIAKLYNYLGLDPGTGQYRFEDYNIDGKFTSADQKAIVDLSPKYFGGLQNSLNYKNFNLDFLFQFVKKDSYNLDSYSSTAPGAAMTNLPKEFLNRWSSDNPNARYTQAIHYSSPQFNQTLTYLKSTATVSDGSYIRLKNVALSYSLKIPKYKIDSCKFYLQAQNLWTLTNYYGLDPEFTMIGSLPPLRTYCFNPYNPRVFLIFKSIMF